MLLAGGEYQSGLHLFFFNLLNASKATLDRSVCMTLEGQTEEVDGAPSAGIGGLPTDVGLGGNGLKLYWPFRYRLITPCSHASWEVLMAPALTAVQKSSSIL